MKQKKSHAGSKGLATTLLFLGVTSYLCAQDATEVGEKLAQNQEALQGLKWMRATTAKQNGDVVSETNEHLFYDIDGTVQSSGPAAGGTPAAPKGGNQTGASPASAKKPTAGHGGKGRGGKGGKGRKGKGSSSTNQADKAAKEQQKTMELIDDVSAAALSYGAFDPERMKAFLKKAAITPSNDAIKIQGKGFSDKDDSLTMELDADSMSPRRLEVQSKLDGKPINITATYQETRDGPAAIERLVADYPEKDVRVEIEDSSFVSSDGSASANVPDEGQLGNRPGRRPRR